MRLSPLSSSREKPYTKLGFPPGGSGGVKKTGEFGLPFLNGRIPEFGGGFWRAQALLLPFIGAGFFIGGIALMMVAEMSLLVKVRSGSGCRSLAALDQVFGFRNSGDWLQIHPVAMPARWYDSGFPLLGVSRSLGWWEPYKCDGGLCQMSGVGVSDGGEGRRWGIPVVGSSLGRDLFEEETSPLPAWTKSGKVTVSIVENLAFSGLLVEGWDLRGGLSLHAVVELWLGWTAGFSGGDNADGGERAEVAEVSLEVDGVGFGLPVLFLKTAAPATLGQPGCPLKVWGVWATWASVWVMSLFLGLDLGSSRRWLDWVFMAQKQT